METYLVTSDRLIWARGATVTTTDLEYVNIQALIDGGHLSPQGVKKSAKTKDIETEKDY
jgi:hypothetical protein